MATCHPHGHMHLLLTGRVHTLLGLAPGRLLRSWPEPRRIRSPAFLFLISSPAPPRCSRTSVLFPQAKCPSPLCVPGSHRACTMQFKQGPSENVPVAPPLPFMGPGLACGQCVARWLCSSFCELGRPGTVSPLSGLYCPTQNLAQRSQKEWFVL